MKILKKMFISIFCSGLLITPNLSAQSTSEITENFYDESYVESTSELEKYETNEESTIEVKINDINDLKEFAVNTTKEYKNIREDDVTYNSDRTVKMFLSRYSNGKIFRIYEMFPGATYSNGIVYGNFQRVFNIETQSGKHYTEALIYTMIERKSIESEEVIWYRFEADGCYNNYKTKIKSIDYFVGGLVLKRRDLYTNGKLNSIREYYYYNLDDETTDEMNYVKAIYNMDEDGNIKNLTEYQEGNKIKTKVYYHPNTKYGEHLGKEKYRFFMDENNSEYVLNGREYNSKGLLTNVYIYYPNTVYGQHVGKEKYKFYISGDGKDVVNKCLYFSESGSLLKTISYQPNTKYGEHVGKELG